MLVCPVCRQAPEHPSADPQSAAAEASCGCGRLVLGTNESVRFGSVPHHSGIADRIWIWVRPNDLSTDCANLHVPRVEGAARFLPDRWRFASSRFRLHRRGDRVLAYRCVAGAALASSVLDS